MIHRLGIVSAGAILGALAALLVGHAWLLATVAGVAFVVLMIVAVLLGRQRRP